MPDVRDLELLVQAKTPLVIIESIEESRVLETLARLATRMSRPFYRWTITDGLTRLGFGFELMPDEASVEPGQVLTQIRKMRQSGVFALCDFHPYLSDPRLVRRVKDIALSAQQTGHTLIFISHRFGLPPELGGLSARFELRLPSTEQILALVKEEAAEWASQKGGTRVRADNQALQHLVRHLVGLTVGEVRRLARTAIYDDGAIDHRDLPEVHRAKFELMNLGGVLTYVYDTSRMDDIAGLDNLKDWLQRRRHAFITDREASSPKTDLPKGLLLLGVQGCGKSLAARAVADLWKLPCLRLDFGALYNKFHGETERNLREALRLAEQMSPCVLWLDEIEKGVGVAQHDEGVSARLLGSLLTWMAERKKPVFLVATANNLDAMPAELIRKGRFDEIFFIDLPLAPVRRGIIELHLRKRGRDLSRFDLALLADASEGFSGAEIEQVIVSGLYREGSEQSELDTAMLLAEFHGTQPLSITMAEKVAALRHWAAGRCISADR